VWASKNEQLSNVKRGTLRKQARLRGKMENTKTESAEAGRADWYKLAAGSVFIYVSANNRREAALVLRKCRRIVSASHTMARSSPENRTRSRSTANCWICSRQSSIHGRGVYAQRLIPSGTRVVEYSGERITKAEAHRREEQRKARQRRGGDGCVYIFDLNKKYDLDGRSTRNIARLINHSCAPNCRAETIRGRVWIIARRDIAVDEEITFDYGFPYSEWRLHPCRCGAARCVGYIVNKPQRWRVRRLLRQERKAPATNKVIRAK
jgi:hypothetical protein